MYDKAWTTVENRRTITLQTNQMINYLITDEYKQEYRHVSNLINWHLVLQTDQ